MEIWCEKLCGVLETADLTWNDEASMWEQNSVDQGPWFLREVLLVFKDILEEIDNPKCPDFSLPVHLQGAFSDLLHFSFILTWDLGSAVWI